MRKKNSRIVALLMAMMLLFALLPASALAIDPFDNSKAKSLTVWFNKKSEATEDAAKEPITVNIYAIAQIRNTLVEKFSMMSRFTQYESAFADAFDGGNAGQWQSLAREIADYIEAQETTDNPIKKSGSVTAKQDAGKIRVPISVPAIYLVVVERFVSDKTYYEMAPQLVSVPSHPVEDGVQNKEIWIYDVEITGKMEEHDRTDLIDITVTKEWDDSGWSASSRPKTITINLLKDGEEYDTITLPKTKDGKSVWSHTWTKLDPAPKWSVEEEKPENYTPQIGKMEQVSKNKYEVTITNYRPPKKSDSELPQTGLDWWPVAALAIGGMALFFLGWLARRADEESDEA